MAARPSLRSNKFNTIDSEAAPALIPGLSFFETGAVRTAMTVIL